jgi:hypothetical protein
MKPLVLIALTSLIVGAGAPAAATAATSKPVTHCGHYGWIDELEDVGWTYDISDISGAGIFHVKAVKTDCTIARRVSRNAYAKNPRAQRWSYRGWKCRYNRQGYEFASIRCARRSGKIVRWATAA